MKPVDLLRLEGGDQSIVSHTQTTATINHSWDDQVPQSIQANDLCILEVRLIIGTGIRVADEHSDVNDHHECVPVIVPQELGGVPHWSEEISKLLVSWANLEVFNVLLSVISVGNGVRIAATEPVLDSFTAEFLLLTADLEFLYEVTQGPGSVWRRGGGGGATLDIHIQLMDLFL